MEDAAFVGGGARRRRDEPEEVPEAKRICAVVDLTLLDTLDDADPADVDLASVMRSFQEEITSSAEPPGDDQRLYDGAGVSTATGDRLGSDLGYLLEASDDELGLPPTVLPSSSSEGDGAEGDFGEEGTRETSEFGQIWGLEDEMPSSYDALGWFGDLFEDGSVIGGEGGGAFLDTGLFDYADAATVGDLAEFSWQAESLSAL